MRCRDLQELANAPHLRGFLCCALLRVAPYCVPGVNRGIVTLRSCSLAETHPKYVQHLARLANIQPALRTHFLQGHAWVTQGDAPPTSTRLATVGGDAEIARDSKGNALLVEITGASAPRLPFVELGEATFITGFLGTYEPHPPPTIEQVGFSSFSEYLAAFEVALDVQVHARYMLNEDANAMLNRANLFPSETFTENYFRRYDEFRAGEYCP
jgi:hypothetical protein